MTSRGLGSGLVVFGSGKSLLMKELGVLLEGGELLGQPVHKLFLSRLPSHSEERADLERFLAMCQRKLSTSVIGGKSPRTISKQQ